MKNFNIFKKSTSGLIILVIITFIGIEVFQGQKAVQPINENIYNYDESDPYIDRPTREAFSHMTETSEEDLDIITDATGFDNFEMGTDGAEQMLVSNPRNPLNMQFGVNGSPQNSYYTLDGYTWTSSNPAYAPGTCCDPWSAFDSLGNLFYGSGVNGQNVYKSLNGGATFGPFLLSVSGNDRNTLAADQTNGPYTNFLYAAITPGNFARSTNNGTSWTQTFTASNTIPGVMIAVGPNGSIQGGTVMYVTNTGSTQNVVYSFYRSNLGGASGSFTLRSTLTVAGYVGTLNSAGRLVINNGRTRPYPMIAMDNSYGPNRGRLYLVYASNVPAGNGSKPDIILQYSNDQGLTWSSKITVNDNADPSLSHQWFPAIWCEKETGRLYIKWYDTRENPATFAVNVYATYSDNGGTSFAPNQKLTNATWTFPTPACSPNTNCYRGDYDGCTANPKTSFNVWTDGRLGNYKNVGAYFPDFAMLTTPASNTVHETNSSVNYLINIPAVKLFTDTATFSATVSPAPASGSIQFEFLDGNTLTTYPNTKYVKVKTVGTVTSGAYTITITGKGTNGTPVHKRTVSLTVNATVGPTICEDFTLTKFPPASMYEEYSGTNYWTRGSVTAYGIGAGSAKFDFFNAPIGNTQSLVSNNFPNTGANTYLTFDEAYAAYGPAIPGPDQLVIETSANFGVSYGTLITLTGNVDGTGELNTAPAQTSAFTPSSSQWRPKIFLLPAGTNKIRLKAISGSANNLYLDNICVQVLEAAVSNSSCAMPEGFYRPTPSPNVIPDTIRTYLHRSDFPNIIVDSAIVVYGTNGCMSNIFNRALDGNYYVVWKHRNSIETWTAVSYAYTRGVSLPTLDIIQNNGLVFAGNQKLVDLTFGYYGMYGGDVTGLNTPSGDNYVNLDDIIAVHNNAILFPFGYLQTDLTGDNTTNLTDVIIVHNNASLFIKRESPLGAEPEPSRGILRADRSER